MKRFKKSLSVVLSISLFSLSFNCFQKESIASINKSFDDGHHMIDKKLVSFGGSGFDRFIEIVETDDGGYVAVGISSSTDAGFSSKGEQDAIIVKFDNSLNVQWVRNFGGSSNDMFNDVINTSDGCYIAVGSVGSGDAGVANSGLSDSLIVKYDNDGNQLWANTFGGSNVDYFSSIAEDTNGDLFMVGYSESSDAGFSNKGRRDNTLLKYDKDGNQEWVKTSGGSHNDSLYSIGNASPGNFIVAGNSYSKDFEFANKGGSDAYILEYDNNGNKISSNFIGWGGDDAFSDVIMLKDGSFVGLGYNDSSTGGISNGKRDGLVAKYKPDDSPIIKSYGGLSTDLFWAGAPSSDGGFVAVGYSDSNDLGLSNKGLLDSLIVKYDKYGNVQWDKSIGGSGNDWFRNVIQLSNDDIIAVGHSNSLDAGFSNKGDYDAILVLFGDSMQDAIDAVDKVEESKDATDLDNARDIVNKLPESIDKDLLQDRLDSIFPNLSIDKKTHTSNVDLYLKPQNVLSLSLDTNSITFEDFDSTEDMEKQKALSLTINSSLAYKVNASLPTGIVSTTTSNSIDSSLLHIRAHGQTTYQPFVNVLTPVTLLDFQSPGASNVHEIDLMLKGGVINQADVFKGVLKFEIEQK